MMTITLGQLRQRFGGEICGSEDAVLGPIVTDSRAVVSGDTFVALVGDRFNAHQFIADVIGRGAQLVVVSHDWATANGELLDGRNAWRVSDTNAALGQIAQLAREAFTGPLVGITGSCGKTTVKEMLLAIAVHVYGGDAVLATQGNLNNHFGVPQTLLRLAPEHRFAIVEMGASGPDEISYLANMAQPTVSVVNNVMAAHVEGFGSLAGVATTKSAIYDGLGDDGVAVINVDDAFAPQFQQQNTHRASVTFSLEQVTADFYAKDVRVQETGSQFQLCAGEQSFAVTLPITGLHNVRNALAAAACAHSAGVPLSAIAEGLTQVKAAKGRMNSERLTPQLTLIDDTYNANPDSTRAAIDALLAFEGDSWLVLGDMGELGPDARKLHAEIGDYAKAAGLAAVIGVGPLSADAVQAYGASSQFDDHAGAVAHILQQLERQAGRINILIKGSRSARMELVVQAIKDQVRTA